MDIETILIVDDEQPFRDMLAEMLKDRAGRIMTAKDGKEALNVLIETGGVDVVLTDMKMPGMNGFQLLEGLKTLDPNLSVVIMTGYSDLFSAEEAMKRGADGYIMKPFKKEEINALIARARRRSLSMNKDRLVEEKKQLLEYTTFANKVIAASDYPSPHKEVLLAMGERIKRSAMNFLTQIDN
ncbi:response regulator [Candidatus Poribacteria bacterium]|nr:response regulator [Candidatus Poribacteria bacterium]